MRKPFVAGNWKMNTDGQSGVDLATGVADGSSELAGRSVDVAVCPPFVYLQAVTRAVSSANVAVGAQDEAHLPGVEGNIRLVSDLLFGGGVRIEQARDNLAV